MNHDREGAVVSQKRTEYVQRPYGGQESDRARSGRSFHYLEERNITQG